MMELEQKVYFTPGMICRCTKLKNAPEMYVVRKKEFTVKEGDERLKTLQGIVCRYMDKNGVFHDELFSTKDLAPVE